MDSFGIVLGTYTCLLVLTTPLYSTQSQAFRNLPGPPPSPATAFQLLGTPNGEMKRVTWRKKPRKSWAFHFEIVLRMKQVTTQCCWNKFWARRMFMILDSQETIRGKLDRSWTIRKPPLGCPHLQNSRDCKSKREFQKLHSLKGNTWKYHFTALLPLVMTGNGRHLTTRMNKSPRSVEPRLLLFFEAPRIYVAASELERLHNACSNLGSSWLRP